MEWYFLHVKWISCREASCGMKVQVIKWSKGGSKAAYKYTLHNYKLGTSFFIWEETILVVKKRG